MLTIKEYAEKQGKSVQSVYKQMRSKENAVLLEGHIHTQKINNKNVKVLDEIAVQVLNNASMQSIQIIEQNQDKETIERLEQENKKLLLKVAELQDLLLKEKEEVKQLQNDKIQLLEAKQESEPPKKWWKFW